MQKKRKPGEKAGKNRQPPVKIQLPFNQALKGLLALSPEDAKAVRDADKKKR